MTEGEQAILREIGNLRTHVEQGFRECRSDIRNVYEDIDKTNTEVGKVKSMALVTKTKNGTFIAGMVFVFTGIFGVISHYVGTQFK